MSAPSSPARALRVAELARRMGVDRSTLGRALANDPVAPKPAHVDDKHRPAYLPDQVEAWWPNRSPRGRPARSRTNVTSDADASDWSPLHGIEITFKRANGKPSRGVVLPPATRTPPGQLRIAPTHLPGRSPQPGEVTTINPAAYVIDPTVATVEQRFRPSRRRSRGPEGLPLYHGAIPENALATRTQLRTRHRRKLAAGQHPIAQFYAYRYIDLYAVVDAEPLPPLDEDQQRLWDHVRTCARCGSQTLDAVPKSRFGPRYCPAPCRDDEATDRWRAGRERGQRDTIAWASDLLHDGRAVWVFAQWDTFTPLLVTRTCDGTELANLSRVSLHPDDELSFRHIDDRAAVTRASDTTALLRDLASYRLIAWDHTTANVIHRLQAISQPGADRVRALDIEVVDRRYAEWLGLSHSEQPKILYRQLPELIRAKPPNGVPSDFGEVVALLREMAAGPPTKEHLDAARSRRVPGEGIRLSDEQAYTRPVPHQPEQR